MLICKQKYDIISVMSEMEQNDHRKLGRQLDLFTFSDLVGAGLPLWTPRGTFVCNLLDEYVWTLRKEHGYERVRIPHITKKDLYVTSGHWDKFKDDLFHIVTREGDEFALKPMNCPHHIQIFDRRPHSYREMPQRYTETTMVYRDEQSGELNGLSRVRAINMDDAHTFCREAQVKEEAVKVLGMIREFYKSFGFSLKVRLSFRDPEHPEKYLGDTKRWENSEKILREVAKENGIETVDGPGEAAFYGPKLDFMAKDSLGREWQVATIQIDMNMPERFDLTCINERGEKERIVMIHAAIMGSIERFLSVILEHLGGNLPLWLSPVQVKVIPVRTNHNEYAKKVFDMLKENNIRAELDDKDENLGSQIRDAKQNKIPYWLVIGDKEVEGGKATLESRDAGQVGQVSKEELLNKLLQE